MTIILNSFFKSTEFFILLLLFLKFFEKDSQFNILFSSFSFSNKQFKYIKIDLINIINVFSVPGLPARIKFLLVFI